MNTFTMIPNFVFQRGLTGISWFDSLHGFPRCKWQAREMTRTTKTLFRRWQKKYPLSGMNVRRSWKKRKAIGSLMLKVFQSCPKCWELPTKLKNEQKSDKIYVIWQTYINHDKFREGGIFFVYSTVRCCHSASWDTKAAFLFLSHAYSQTIFVFIVELR